MFRLSTTYKIPAAVVLSLALAACSKPSRTTAENAAQPANSSQKTFDSPTAAGEALYNAARTGDRHALVAIFGPDAIGILFTGNAKLDRQQLQDFAGAYRQMNRWGKIKAGGETLYVGADNYAFPVPLGQTPSGKWYFDTAAGKDEILARRIGKNELTAMAATQAAAAAQRQFFQENHRYASKFASDPGKQDGLYWPAAEGQPPSPLGQLGDFGKVVGSGSAEPFDGYYYRMIAKPGGYVIVAYPAQYRDSGIMTFVITQDGTVYQKDLGEKTAELAAALAGASPADGWTRATAATGTASRQR
jgi:Protein of unknown function (DUF2950)